MGMNEVQTKNVQKSDYKEGTWHYEMLGKAILGIEGNPIKSLGKWFAATQNDKEAIAGL